MSTGALHQTPLGSLPLNGLERDYFKWKEEVWWGKSRGNGIGEEEGTKYNEDCPPPSEILNTPLGRTGELLVQYWTVRQAINSGIDCDWLKVQTRFTAVLAFCFG